MTLIVYPCGPRRGDLLRYSLRSLAAGAGADLPDVLLIGDVPDYIDRGAVRVRPLAQTAGRFRNVWNAWAVAAAELHEAEWWWWNDDFILTGALSEALLDTHRGSLQGFCESLRGRPDVSMYRRRAEAALRVLQGEGYAEPLSWEAHTPLRATGPLVDYASAMCERAGVGVDMTAVRTLIATGAHREGLLIADPKVDHPREHRLPYPIASPGLRAWNGGAGREVRDRFPKPSPWERV